MNAVKAIAEKERAAFKQAWGERGRQVQKPLFAKRYSREHDEAVLEWIVRREAGEHIRDIAADFGCSAGAVSRAVNAVLAEIDA